MKTFASIVRSGLLLMLILCDAAASHAQILSAEAIKDKLPIFDENRNYEKWDVNQQLASPKGSAAVTTATDQQSTPLSVMLTRRYFPAEDRTIDAIVCFDGRKFAPPDHSLSIELLSKTTGKVIKVGSTKCASASQLFLSVAIPESLYGDTVTLRVALVNSNNAVEDAAVEADAEIGSPVNLPKQSVVSLKVEAGALPIGAPCRVGIPLPRGLLSENSGGLRLSDESGQNVPFDIQNVSKWAKHGTLKWMFLNFLSSNGSPNGIYRLSIDRTAGQEVQHDNLVAVSQKLSVSEVVALARRVASTVNKPSGAQIITDEFLRGGFVEHVRGENYSGWGLKTLLTPGERFDVPSTATWTVEAVGKTLIQLRCEDWFVDETTQSKFCRFIARLRIYPGSPFLDFEYTWTFTGDGNRDRIRNMGWEFGVSGDPRGFLTEDEQTPSGVGGDALLQYDSRGYEISAAGKVVHKGIHSEGVALKRTDNTEIAMAVRDLWENFPSEIEMAQDKMTFYLWPRNGKPRSHPISLDNAYRLWFAHEGETLSFSLPIELTENPLYAALSGVEPPFAHGMPESVNAQGIDKTTEIRFYIGNKDSSAKNIGEYFKAWNARENDPSVDPKWVEQTQVYPGTHSIDPERLKDFEDDYERVALWPERYIESLQIYGKWIYGDLPMVGYPEKSTAGLYRAYDKAHWGWPYSWVPYIRSGDARYKKLADAATRMMSDTAYCHYVSEDVSEQFRALPMRTEWASYQPFRAKGWNNEGLIPWAGGYWGPTARMYCDKVDFLLDSWHLTGYAPAYETACDWMAQTKEENLEQFGRGPITSDPIRARWADNLMRQYLYAYEETFDPWFIAAAHAIAQMHLWMEKNENWHGQFWQDGSTDYLRFTQDPDYGKFYLRFARNLLSTQNDILWGKVSPLIQPAVYAYQYSGDDWFLQRARSYVSDLHAMIRNTDDPEMYDGWLATGGSNECGLYFGWYLRYAPQICAALIEKPHINTIYNSFRVISDIYGTANNLIFPRIWLKVPKSTQTPLILLNMDGIGAQTVDARITNSINPIQTGKVPLKNGDNVIEFPWLKDGGVFSVEINAPNAISPSRCTMRLPIASDDINEVYEEFSGGRIPSSKGMASYWLKVDPSKATGNLSMFLPFDEKFPVRRASVWGENGDQRADVQTLNREIPVAGLVIKLPLTADGEDAVRLTLPGRYEYPVLPDTVESLYSVSKEKWFQVDRMNQQNKSASSDLQGGE